MSEIQPANRASNLIIFFVPLSELAETLAKWGGRTEAEVLFQGRGVGKGDRYSAGLHGHKLLMSLKVIVGGEYFSCNEFFLKDGDKVQKILRAIVANIINLVGRNWQTIFQCANQNIL